MNHSRQQGSATRLAVCGVFLSCFLLVSSAGNPQSKSNKHDLSSEIDKFSDYTHDLQAAMKTVQGADVETTSFLENMSAVAEERLISLKYTLRIYDTISSEPDRGKVKSIVKEQLSLNAYLLNSDTDRLAEFLSFVKVPAIAQTGLKMKDDMRAARANWTR